MTDTVRLTTVDNPWDPFTHYTEWMQFDEASGYYSNALLARVAIVSDETSELDQDIAVKEAIETIVSQNVSGMHRMAIRSSEFSETGD